MQSCKRHVATVAMAVGGPKYLGLINPQHYHPRCWPTWRIHWRSCLVTGTGAPAWDLDLPHTAGWIDGIGHSSMQ